MFTALSPQAQSPKKAPVQQVRAVALRAGRRRHLHWKVPVVGCAGKAGDEGGTIIGYEDQVLALAATGPSSNIRHFAHT